MGLIDRESMATSALTLGGIPIKSNPITITLACLTLFAWIAVAVIAMETEARWVIAAVGAAITVSLSALAAVCVEAVGRMLAGHADRMERATRSHGADMRAQVFNLNWLTTSKYRGEERARIDAARAIEAQDSSETGPFRAINGTR